MTTAAGQGLQLEAAAGGASASAAGDGALASAMMVAVDEGPLRWVAEARLL